jgi:hypothetical protein
MKILAAEISFGDGTEYIATAAFATAGSDTPANKLFRARLSDVQFERSVSFALWRGDRSIVPAVQDIVLPNADGALDAWLYRDIKDREVVLKSGTIDEPYSTWAVRARLTSDRIAQAGRTALVIKFKSKLQRIDKQATSAWSTAAPNAEIRGIRSPIAIGQLAYAGGVLYQHHSNTQRFYSVSDWPIYGISVWWSQYLIGVTPGYYVQGVPEAIYGLRRRTTASNPGPDDRLCLEMRGAVRLGTELVGSAGEFTSWTGDVPDGWSVSEGPGGLVTEFPTGSASISGEDTWITWTGLEVGKTYQIEVLTSALYSGVFQIRNGAADLYYQPYDTALADPRVWRVTFIAGDTSISIGIPESATGNVSINRVRVWGATPVDYIDAWVRHLCIDRGGLVSADIDSASLAALESAKPYAMAFANDQGAQNSELLWKALDSLNAALFEGIDGTLKSAWLQDPSDMKPVGTITDDDLAESWEWEDDEMDGLSTSMRYATNYAQLSASEIQTLQSAVTLSQATVEALRRADLGVSSTVAPASHYSRSAESDAAKSLLVATADAQDEVDERCSLAGARRHFGRCALKDRPAFAAMEPGQSWTVVSARWGSFDVYVVLVRGTLLGSEPVLRLRVWR